MKCYVVGFDSKEYKPFKIEVDTKNDIEFGIAFCEFFTVNGFEQIPMEYIERVIFEMEG